MTYDLHILTANEEAFTHGLENVREADELIPLFGNKFSEVKSITLVAKTQTGEEIVLHKQSFA